MRLLCEAVVENELQRQNLCQCVKILGGVPTEKDIRVVADVRGDSEYCGKFIELFEQYTEHTIQIKGGCK